jgi:hypothetical protein
MTLEIQVWFETAYKCDGVKPVIEIPTPVLMIESLVFIQI